MFRSGRAAAPPHRWRRHANPYTPTIAIEDEFRAPGTGLPVSDDEAEMGPSERPQTGGTSETGDPGAGGGPSRAERFAGEYRLLGPLPVWGNELPLPRGSLQRGEHVLSRERVLLALLDPPPERAEQSDLIPSSGERSEPAASAVGRALWDRALRLSHVDHHALPQLVESSSPGRGGGSAAPPAFLAWQLDHGPTCRERLAERPAGLGAIEALRVVQHLAEGLEAVHGRDEIHGCLAAANVLLTPVGARLLAVGFGPFQHRAAGGPAAGWIYRAPEQLPGGGGAIGPACDVWALGVLLHELVTGAPPLHSRDGLAAAPHDIDELVARLPELSALTPAVSEASSRRQLVELLGATLQIDPAQRWRAGEIAQRAHQAIRELQPRQTAARGTPMVSSAGGSTSARSENRSDAGDWHQARGWLGERRRALAMEEDTVPLWLLWMLPAAALAAMVAMVWLLLVLLR
ncbi:MAG: hypothetical protein DWQ36_15800 [Acidobacteria bacterium]|nr:MAG: hypothetical protein DWQ30_14475 [Acidobacteriota bacterium]REK05576.1 MAG: hypothetical protein DWQ36_15800 [Acidobacteriota bacterium]